MVNGTFYKRGFTLPLLKCVSVEEGDYILRRFTKEFAKATQEQEY